MSQRSTTPRLYVNLDHVATLRRARGTPYPSVVEAAILAQASGFVDGVTLHLREDRRHIVDADMRAVPRAIALPFNFEMSVAPDVVAVALEVRPAIATLVPERRAEVTTEGGLDLEREGTLVAEVTARLRASGAAVSCFIDPDPEAVARAAALGATHVELHTGPWAEHRTERERARLERAALEAADRGLIVNAGHGLTCANVGPVAALPGLSDLNIGHAIVSRALFVGLSSALGEMRAAIARGIEGSH